MSLYRIVKDVVWLRSVKPGIVFSQAVKRLWRTSHHHEQLSLNIQRERCFRPVFTGNEQPLFTKKSQISANGGGKGNTMVFGCLTGHHTKMPVKLAPSSCTATAKGLAQETVNAVELESISLGCVNVKMDV